MTGKKATFCIAAYDDAVTLYETVVNILETVSGEDIGIIIVDDSNNLDESPFKSFGDVSIFHNAERRGVGYSLDFAVKQAKTDIVFILGCDVRFSVGWFDRFYSVVRSHPTSIVNSVCAGLAPDRRYLTGKENHYYAAHILFHVTEKNNRKPALPFREYLEGKWNNWPRQRRLDCNIEQVGCLMGAFYGCHRDWFLKIRGFEGHKTWGTLEPLLSLRSYVAGGDCIIDGKTVVGHIFKAASSKKPIRDLIYNKLLVASTLLPKDMEKTVYEWAATLKHGRDAIKMIKEDSQLVSLLAGFGRESVKKFGVDSEWDEEQLITLIKPTGVMDE